MELAGLLLLIFREDPRFVFSNSPVTLYGVLSMVLLLKRVVSQNRQLIFSEARQMEGFLRLLFKQRNTAQKWTKEEKEKLRGYLKRSSLYMPITIIFLLPGGLVLLLLLAALLDRRRSRRAPIGLLVRESGSAV